VTRTTGALATFYQGVCDSQGSYEQLLWTTRFAKLVKHLKLPKQRRFGNDPGRTLVEFTAGLRRHWLDVVRRHRRRRQRLHRTENHDDEEDENGTLDDACLSLLTDVFPIASADQRTALAVENGGDDSTEAFAEQLRDLVVGRLLTAASLRKLHDEVLLPRQASLGRLFEAARRHDGLHDGVVGKKAAAARALQAVVKALVDVLARTDDAAGDGGDDDNDNVRH
jgi:hypothetical protein